MSKTPIPLSLYIHIPWCLKKCPYCDFNSYQLTSDLPEQAYSQRLTKDLIQDLSYVQNRPLRSIFFGGGTPSLFTPRAIETILNNVKNLLPCQDNIEITLEANPGTLEHSHFKDYKSAGINRISLGAQSFQDHQLYGLGRIHTADETKNALDAIIEAQFNSFNIDLMFGLPNQTLDDAIFDLQTALSFNPPHLSWYHLTIEPNTIFHHQKPPLPSDEIVLDIQTAGYELLKSANLMQYEVSAFSKIGHSCQHNINYWEFGDYLGIGAGAHGKITDLENQTITRYWKTRYPKDYLNTEVSLLGGSKIVSTEELPLEFMLNSLRLSDGTTTSLFETRTFLPISTVQPALEKAHKQGLLTTNDQKIIPTELGRRFLNDLVAIFLD